MKKLFSLFVLLMLTATLAGCSSDTTNYKQQILDLQQQIATLQEEKSTLTQKVEDASSLQEQIDNLQVELDKLEASHFDVTISISLINVDGSETNRLFGFNKDESLTLLDILKANFIVDSTTGDYGTMITTINGMIVPYGAYIALSQNDEMSMVGIDDIVMHDNDHFTFQVLWWDTTQEAVYNALQRFINQQLDHYLTPTMMNYSVLLGCDNLCDGNPTYDAAHQDTVLSDYVDNLSLVTVQDYFKAVMITNEITTTTLSESLLNQLNSIVATGPYGKTALGLIALDSIETTVDYSDYVNSAFTYYNTSTPVDEGLDAGGLALVALAKYQDEAPIATLINDYMTYVKTNQLQSGGIKTMDMEYGGVVYPGTENAASISQVIIGLVANGIDPASAEYTTDTNGNLVLRLTEFQLADGSFDWDLTDDIQNDLTFSTPQAFFALSTYYQFMNTYGAVTNLYEK